jgi:hypothetical protein
VVVPIFEFNRERRLFQENASWTSEGAQLLRALLFAKTTNNHHFHFWLVRNYANRLCGGESEQAPSPASKRQKT